VHLHPRAQAALGTFFAELVASSKKQFVIETHSDYLVDRVRLSVTEGIIDAKDVQLIYLERDGLDIKVHEIDLDENGNLTNAPSGYRKFFLQEEIKLMTRLSK
jgi:predicted ATPase